MDFLRELATNPFLVTPIVAWFVAQLLKVIINLIMNKKLIWERLIGDGGMPSGHSATVASLALITALMKGVGSFEFAIGAILAIIVCHDAAGVRWETGRQARVLNDIIRILESKELPETKLKELVGHTPLQVAMGVLVGAVVAVAMYFVWRVIL